MISLVWVYCDPDSPSLHLTTTTPSHQVKIIFLTAIMFSLSIIVRDTTGYDVRLAW